MAAMIDKQPYLTPHEVADELGVGVRNVYKLIKAGKLPALKRSERQTLISRWALDAYQRQISGKPSLVTAPRELSADIDDLAAAFNHRAGGRSPQEFYEAFKAGEVDDTSQNMTLLVQAIALGAGNDRVPAPITQPAEHEWAMAAFTTHQPR